MGISDSSKPSFTTGDDKVRDEIVWKEVRVDNSRVMWDNITACPGSSYYEVLGLPVSASQLQIKKAYRAMMLKYHPDKRPDTQKQWATDIASLINRAYEVLSNPLTRTQYDIQLLESGGR